MAAYFASDVHLRLDRPERARRFSAFVDRLGAEDSLVVAGDLCDFWFASRQASGDLPGCSGLRSLSAFRDRGGRLTLLAGNHDGSLGAFYRRVLGEPFLEEPLVGEAHGLRFHLVHGHRMGARPFWKGGMESRAFLEVFRRLPSPVAAGLDGLLDRSNHGSEEAEYSRHLAAYRRQAAGLPDPVDLAIFGHIHRPSDESGSHPRLIVLGGWFHQASYLRIDEGGAELVIRRDGR